MTKFPEESKIFHRKPKNFKKPQGTSDKDLEKVSETTGGVKTLLFLQPVQGFTLNLGLRARFSRDEFAPALGNEQHSPPDVKKHAKLNC